MHFIELLIFFISNHSISLSEWPADGGVAALHVFSVVIQVLFM